jgi:hypothetical protein
MSCWNCEYKDELLRCFIMNTCRKEEEKEGAAEDG